MTLGKNLSSPDPVESQSMSSSDKYARGELVHFLNKLINKRNVQCMGPFRDRMSSDKNVTHNRKYGSWSRHKKELSLHSRNETSDRCHRSQHQRDHIYQDVNGRTRGRRKHQHKSVESTMDSNWELWTRRNKTVGIRSSPPHFVPSNIDSYDTCAHRADVRECCETSHTQDKDKILSDASVVSLGCSYVMDCFQTSKSKWKPMKTMCGCDTEAASTDMQVSVAFYSILTRMFT